MIEVVSYFYARSKTARNDERPWHVVYSADEWQRVLRHRGWSKNGEIYRREMEPSEIETQNSSMRYGSYLYRTLDELLEDENNVLSPAKFGKLKVTLSTWFEHFETGGQGNLFEVR